MEFDIDLVPDMHCVNSTCTIKYLLSFFLDKSQQIMSQELATVQ